MAMSTVRAFIACPLEGPVFDAVAQLRGELSATVPEVRWVRPENLHLTLAFLGDIPEDSLEKIGRSMLSIGDIFAPVEVAVGGLGAFPSLRRPRVIWLGLDGGQALYDLQAAVAGLLHGLHIPWDDKPFKPHLTLGRCRRPVPGLQQRLATYMKAQCGHLQLARLVLFESRLTAQGARHLPRHETWLGQRN